MRVHSRVGLLGILVVLAVKSVGQVPATEKSGVAPPGDREAVAQPLGRYGAEQPKLTFRGVAGSGGAKSLNFEVNSVRLDLAKAKPAIEDMCTKMSDPRRQSHMFLIAGHADQRGSDQVNDPLSQGRADAVKTALVSQCGIPATRMEAKGYGKRYPLNPLNNEVAWEANRRVELWDLTDSPRPYAAIQGSPVVEVNFLYQDGSGRSGVLSDGMTLRSGEYYRIGFRPHEPCFVYVIQQDASRTYRLFPKSGASGAVNANQNYWVDEAGWLQLDNAAGQETIYLAVSHTALDGVEQRISRLRVRGTPDAAPTTTPTTTAEAFRGPAGVRVLGQGNSTANSSIESENIAFLAKVTFNHR